jgi:hypothetical protein
MNGSIPIAIAAVIVGLLGAGHLVALFTGPQLRPGDELAGRMEASVVPLSDATNMMRLWVGFNTSHALGAMAFSLTFGYLALVQDQMFFDTTYLAVVGVVYLLAMLFTSARYWFNVPSIGISLAALLFLAGIALGPA